MPTPQTPTTQETSPKVEEIIVPAGRHETNGGSTPFNQAQGKPLATGNGHTGLGNGNGNGHAYLSADRQDTYAPTYAPMKSVIREGLKFERHFATEGVGPFDSVKWEKRDAIIKSAEGETVFEKRGVEVPAFWSQNATNIGASHYLYGEHEYSVRDWIDRVAGTIREWGEADGYFSTKEDAQRFYDELAYLMVNQYLAFNS